MRYYATRTIRTQVGRKTISCTAGQRNISEVTRNKFSSTLQQYLVPMSSAPRAQSLNADQALYLVKSYLDGLTAPDMIAGFTAIWSDSHNTSGLECQYRIIAGADVLTEDRGLQNPGSNLASAMMDLAPERFNVDLGESIDRLVAEIRA